MWILSCALYNNKFFEINFCIIRKQRNDYSSQRYILSVVYTFSFIVTGIFVQWVLKQKANDERKLCEIRDEMNGQRYLSFRLYDKVTFVAVIIIIFSFFNDKFFRLLSKLLVTKLHEAWIKCEILWWNFHLMFQTLFCSI